MLTWMNRSNHRANKRACAGAENPHENRSSRADDAINYAGDARPIAIVGSGR
jgi:hypothetical protein